MKKRTTGSPRDVKITPELHNYFIRKRNEGRVSALYALGRPKDCKLYQSKFLLGRYDRVKLDNTCELMSGATTQTMTKAYIALEKKNLVFGAIVNIAPYIEDEEPDWDGTAGYGIFSLPNLVFITYAAHTTTAQIYNNSYIRDVPIRIVPLS